MGSTFFISVVVIVEYTEETEAELAMQVERVVVTEVVATEDTLFNMLSIVKASEIVLFCNIFGGINT